jgi:hypothetical protein
MTEQITTTNALVGSVKTLLQAAMAIFLLLVMLAYAVRLQTAAASAPVAEAPPAA